MAEGNAPGWRRERLLALASLLTLAALAWLDLWLEAARMQAMPADAGAILPALGVDVAAVQTWSIGALSLTFLMWAVMMVAMMLPSAAPAILLYGSMVRKSRERGSVLPSVWVFTAGYLAVWSGFSLAATILQAAFATARLLTPEMASASNWLSAGLLIAAGLYQWLPVKDACLEKCRFPLQFFLFRWRPGAVGALRMGAEHGLFCVGCCWALMLVLFAVGVMNLFWVALLAAFVLVEKLMPAGWWIARLAGIGLVVLGAGIIVAGI